MLGKHLASSFQQALRGGIVEGSGFLKLQGLPPTVDLIVCMKQVY
jgi:hypothetical protein